MTNSLTDKDTKDFLEESNPDKFFYITSVHRDDIVHTLINRGVPEEDANKLAYQIPDYLMERLASKMAGAYCENCFWTDLDVLINCIDEIQDILFPEPDPT